MRTISTPQTRRTIIEATSSPRASFSFTGKQGGSAFDERILAESLPVRTIGEQTFAVRLTTFANIDGKSERGYVDQLDFRVGHNLVSVRSASYREGRSTQDLEEMAQEVL